MIGTVAIVSVAIVALLIVVAQLAFIAGVHYAQKGDGVLRGKHAKEFVRRMEENNRRSREAELADHTGERE